MCHEWLDADYQKFVPMDESSAICRLLREDGIEWSYGAAARSTGGSDDIYASIGPRNIEGKKFPWMGYQI